MEIGRTGSSGSYSYVPLSGSGNHPVYQVSVYDAMRFANWLNNGKPAGDQTSVTTEDGAYTFTGSQSVGARNPGATVVLPNENEWYKAAYYDTSTHSYWDYPTQSNAQVTCAPPTSGANSANCGTALINDGWMADVGSYPNSKSPNGTYDQGGNVAEWTETLHEPQWQMIYARLGGDWESSPIGLSGADSGGGDFGYAQFYEYGFRLAMVPEPGTGLLVIAGLLGLAGWRRVRA
jgi:formylglycine-generating enzyme required for sulfatase activity